MLIVSLLLYPLFAAVVRADSENTEPLEGSAESARELDRAAKTAPTASSNFGKTDRFLPGEEVVGPTGKKMRVWSTEGPVSVSQSPEPFEDTVEKRLPADTHIVIDPEDIRRRNRNREDNRHEHVGDGAPASRDTFDVAPNR